MKPAKRELCRVGCFESSSDLLSRETGSFRLPFEKVARKINTLISLSFLLLHLLDFLMGRSEQKAGEQNTVDVIHRGQPSKQRKEWRRVETGYRGARGIYPAQVSFSF